MLYVSSRIPKSPNCCLEGGGGPEKMPRFWAGMGDPWDRFLSVTLGSVSPTTMAEQSLEIIEDFNNSPRRGEESNERGDS